MAIQSADRRVFEALAGPLHPDDETLVDGYISALGGPELAALQWLQRRHSEISGDAGNIGAGRDSVDYSDTVGWVEEKIAAAVQYINTSSTIVVGTEGQALLDLVAAGESNDVTTTFRTSVSNRRRS